MYLLNSSIMGMTHFQANDCAAYYKFIFLFEKLALRKIAGERCLGSMSGDIADLCFPVSLAGIKPGHIKTRIRKQPFSIL